MEPTVQGASKTKNIFIGIALATAATITAGLLWYKFVFLREPQRNIPHDQNVLVSPANGKVIAITPYTVLDKNYLISKDGAEAGSVRTMTDDVSPSGGTTISIQLEVTDVHVQRVPVDSTILSITRVEGDFNNAVVKTDGNFRYENENVQVLFQTASGLKYKVIQIAGFLARRIYTFFPEGAKLAQGDKYGVIKMGSQVSVILPAGVEVVAKVGDYLIDGESVIAKIS